MLHFLPTEFRRSPLAPWYGQQVRLHARVAGTGTFRGDSHQDGRTLRVTHIEINQTGLIPEDTYLWLPLGSTASERLTRIEKRGLQVATIRATAVVADYVSDNGPSYSLERLSSCEVHAERWYTLNQKSEVVWGQEREGEIDTIVYEVQRHERMERQRNYLQKFAQAMRHRRSDKTSRRILERYFMHHQPVSDAEYGHVRRALDRL